MSYSRTQVRALLVTALAYLRHDEPAETEALLWAAINGLPDPVESSALGLGRPNQDQRVVEALEDLGGDTRCVSLGEIARWTKMTAPSAAKALRRAQDRRSDIRHQPRKGYYLRDQHAP